MAVSGLLGWANIQRLQVECAVPDEIYAGTQTMVTVRLRNDKRLLPSFLLRLQILDSAPMFPVVDRGEEVSLTFFHTFAKRGIQDLGDCTVTSPFPVNFFVRSTCGRLGNEILVFPRPHKRGMVPGADRTDGWDAVSASTAGYEGEVQSIADYSGREPMKMIHWRLSAKHEGLKVKTMAATAVSPVIIEPERLSGETLEARLSAAAYLVNRLIRENRPVGMRINGELIPPARSRTQRLRLLKELALYGEH